jgi:uncharacterized protein (UPF0335 family)
MRREGESMSGKDKIEQDYKNFTVEIEKLAEEEKRKIRDKLDSIRQEAEKTGEDVERSLEEREGNSGKKKVNT